MLTWADTALVRLLSGLGLLLLTAAQPKALTWHHTQRSDADASPGSHVADGDETPLSPATPAEKKKREPLTLASTLPQTMSPRSPVGTVSEAERQAGDGKPKNTFADGPNAGSTAIVLACAMYAHPNRIAPNTVAAERAPAADLARQRLCVISPAGPPTA